MGFFGIKNGTQILDKWTNENKGENTVFFKRHFLFSSEKWAKPFCQKAPQNHARFPQ
jgi:hypothetical protein